MQTRRTDFTSEIDGALATRNLGSRHYSDIARSGNGDMLSDLSEDQLADYEELDGMGEALEELTIAESAHIDGMGSLAKIPKFRSPVAGEVPPFAPKPGMTWMRKRIPTGQRKPGGSRVARVKWVQMNQGRLARLAQEGSVAGMGGFSTMAWTGGSIALGLGAAILAVFLIRRK